MSEDDVSDLDLINNESLGDESTDEDTTSKDETTKEVDEDEVPDISTDEEEETKAEDTDEEDGKVKDKDEETEDEEEVEEVSLLPRAEIADINKKYPKLFKDFPSLRHVIGREAKYAEVYPTIDDAVESREKLDGYEDLDQKIMEGDVSILFKSIKGDGSDPSSYKEFVSNFLPTLYQTDQATYNEITRPVVLSLLHYVKREGVRFRKEPDKPSNLELAVSHISNLIFDNPTPPEIPTAKREDPEVIKLRAKDKARDERIWEDYSEDVGATAEKLLIKEITDGLDPNNVIPKFMRKALIDEIRNETVKAIKSNKSYRSVRDSLWAQARKNPSRAIRQKILATYITVARKTLGPIKNAQLTEAMKVLGKKVNTTPNPKKITTNAQRTGTDKIVNKSSFKEAAKDPKVSDRELLGLR